MKVSSYSRYFGLHAEAITIFIKGCILDIWLGSSFSTLTNAEKKLAEIILNRLNICREE